MGSATCKLIKDRLIELGHRVLRVDPNSTTFKSKQTDRIIYYGGTSAKHISPFIYNKNRSIASNKLNTLRACKEAGLSTVPWCEKIADIPVDWKQIVARATLTGHSGQGITIHNRDEDVPIVPLYTMYVKKAYECRIHIFKGRMIDAQIKRKVRNAEENNAQIRNLHTGWVYCREDFTADQRSINLAIEVCRICHLDFGAVDLIYNKYHDQFYVLEVNTAPGLSGTTLNNYCQAIERDIENV